MDIHPDIMVAVPGGTGPRMQPIRKLLPDAYFFPDAQSRRILRFNKRYYEAMANGTKVSTVRFDEPVVPGAHIFVFEDDAGHRTLDGRVTEVLYYQLDQVTAKQAGLASGTSIEEFRRGLRNHYPGLSDQDMVSVVEFELV